MGDLEGNDLVCLHLLPAEILTIFAIYLIPQDIIALSKVNKNFRQTLIQNFIWKKKFFLHFPYSNPEVRRRNNALINWFAQFSYTAMYEYKSLSLDQKLVFSIFKEGQRCPLVTLTTKILTLNDTSGYKLIYWASKTQKKEFLEDLYTKLEKKYFKSFGAILWACILGSKYEFLKVINPSHLNIKFNHKYLIHLAAEYNKPELIKYIIAKGGNVNLLDDAQNTPLMYAAKMNGLDALKILIHLDADINYVNHFGDNALVAAAVKGHVAIIQYLCEILKNKNNTIQLYNSLLATVQNRNYESFRILMKFNPAPEVLNQLLIFATCNNRILYVQKLLEINAKEKLKAILNVDARDSLNETSVMKAARQGFSIIFEILLLHNANIHLRNFRLETAAFLALQNNHLDIFQKLLEKGIIVNINNNNDLALLKLLAKKNHTAALSKLLPEYIETYIKSLDENTKKKNSSYLTIFSSGKSRSTLLNAALILKRVILQELTQESLGPFKSILTQGSLGIIYDAYLISNSQRVSLGIHELDVRDLPLRNLG